MTEKLFTVQPMSRRFSLEAGGTYTGSITIVNPSDSTENFDYQVAVEPYGLISNNDTFSSASVYSRIVDWITIDNPSGSIAPNDDQIINYTINVPDNAPAGGQYATLVVTQSSDSLTGNGSVNINTILALASVIYADVTGITVRDGAILNNYVPSFSFDPSITLSSTIENKGNVHSDSITIIKVTNNFTGETVFPLDEQDNKFKEIILPETTRYITHNIDNLPLLGSFKVTQTIYFNDTVSEVEQNLIICPLWFIFIVAFTVVTLIALIVARIRHHRHAKVLI